MDEETTEYHSNTKDVPRKGVGVFEDYKDMKLDESDNLADNERRLLPYTGWLAHS